MSSSLSLATPVRSEPLAVWVVVALVTGVIIISSDTRGRGPGDSFSLAACDTFLDTFSVWQAVETLSFLLGLTAASSDSSICLTISVCSTSICLRSTVLLV